MSLTFKSYDPVRHQQRAKRRRQKRPAGHSISVPSSATCINTPPPQSLVAGLECSRVDEKVILSTNPDGTENPYSGYPSVEEILEFCSSLDTDVPSVYTPTSASPLSYTDSAIDIRAVSSDSEYQEKACKDDELRRKLLRAIAAIPLVSESNTKREAHHVNISSTPASPTVSAWERDTGVSSAKRVWSLDAETPSSTASSINTPASATSRTYQKQTSTWGNQDSFINIEDDGQDFRIQVADLSVRNDKSQNALSGVSLSIVQSEDNIAPEPPSSDSSDKLLNQDIQALRVLTSAATFIEDRVIKPSVTEPSITEPSVTEPSVTEPSVTEPSSAKRTSAQGAASSSAKRSCSESGATSSGVYSSSKRPRVASTSSKEAVSLLLEIQKMISNVLAKLDQEQSQVPLPDPSAQPIYETIQVAMDEGNDISSDDSSEIGSTDDTDSETESAMSQQRARQHRSTQRRRWTDLEENLLRRLKDAQKRNGMPSDSEIARRLDRTESGVKQHWDIMVPKRRGKR